MLQRSPGGEKAFDVGSSGESEALLDSHETIEAMAIEMHEMEHVLLIVVCTQLRSLDSWLSHRSRVARLDLRSPR